MQSTSRTPTIAILGAGLGGLGMAITLREAGITRFTVFEKEGAVGGVWRDNTYPGAACDVPSHLYSYSFEPKPDWSRRFAGQREILSYLEHCTAKYRIGPHLRFGTEIASADFDDVRRVWRLRTASGEVHEADILIAACGQLHRPAYPKVAGLERFRGAAFHSARWDHGCDLSGKRVGVIGTGASAIQFVPRIVPKVAQLSVFQRSAPYIISKADHAYGRLARLLYGKVPMAQKLDRALQYGSHEARGVPFLVSPKVMALFDRQFHRYLRREVRDPALRRTLTPDYPIGCKRVLLANDWYESIVQSHVEVVPEAIVEATETGLRTADGRAHTLDALIYGTGFRATEFLAPMRVRGRSGRELSEAWRDGAEAYLGITVAGFPNFFMLYGPNTNLGHNSILFMLESQMRYVLQAVERIARGDARTLEVLPAVQRAFAMRIAEQSDRTVFAEGCTSWYKNDAGRNTNNWPGFTVAYRLATRRLDPADFDARP